MMPTKSDSRRRLNAGLHVNDDCKEFVKVSGGDSEVDGFINEQWVPPSSAAEEKIPWKTIFIILTLFVGGSICIGCATYDWLMDVNQERSDRIWALLIIGALTIIPGGYYLMVLSCILSHRRGYSMDDIRRLG
ncbi:transmembrane protein 230 [Drosophila tropicalis]|uniref:transmembrane protein 230 n=1 Tax=Drosophila tropicalis TaxID=46794 RepID=UPI0035AC2386